MIKKCLSALLCVLLLIQISPVSVSAAPEDLVVRDDVTTGNRIDNLAMYYKKTSSSEFEPLVTGVELDGDNEVKINGEYHVSKADLLANNGEFVYYLPDYLDHITADVKEEIKADSGKYVNMHIEYGVATFRFDDGWNDVLDGVDANVHGKFAFSGEMDGSHFVGGKNTIKIGTQEIEVKLPEGIKGKYSNVSVDKDTPVLYQPGMTGYKMNDPRYSGKSYLLYTVTVYGDPEKSVDNVKVVDAIANDGNGKYVSLNNNITNYTFKDRYLEGYAGVDSTSRNVTDVADVVGTQGEVSITPDHTNDSITWDIGTIEAKGTRTLTYKVVVTDAYVGFKHGVSADGGFDADNGIFKNNAKVFASGYERNEDSSSYTPTANLNIAKYSEAPVFDAANNCYVIEYRVVASAPNTNSYTMTNVKVNDEFDTSGIKKEKVVYDKGSLALYEGNGQHGVAGLKDITSSIPHYSKFPGRGSNPEVGKNSMTTIIGDLQPGESKTLRYTATIPVSQFLENNSGSATITNKANIYDDELKSNPRWAANLGNTSNTKTVDMKHWGGKVAGEISEDEKTITMPSTDDFYDATGTTVVSTSPVSSFTVPENNIEYKIVVNQTGDWNVSGAALHDELSKNTTKDFVFYSGWVKVNAYAITASDRNNLPSSITDIGAYNYLNSKTPVKTVWVKVNDLTSFNFKPTDIGLNGSNLAYTLNYYTYLKDVSASSIDSTNNFKLVGQVGIGGNNYTIAWGGTYITKTFIGENNISYDKESWYYNSEPATGFGKGELYWAINVESSGTILKGTKIKDTPQNGGSNGSHQIVNDKSVVGVYEVPSTGAFSGAYPTLANLEANPSVTKLTDGIDISYGSGSAIVTFTSDYNIASGNSLYIIVKTSPTTLPTDVEKSSLVYTNKVQLQDADKNNFDDGITANQTIMTGYSLKKTANGIFKVVDGTVTAVSGKAGDLEKQYLLVDWTAADYNFTGTNYTYENGVYLTWLITMSEMATGSYTILDKLPEGTELAYVKMFTDGESGTNTNFNGKRKTDFEKYKTEETVSGKQSPVYTYTGKNTKATGTFHKVASNTTNVTKTNNNVFTYYYVDGNNIELYFPDVKEGDPKVVYQVVAKVTDKETLQSGEETEFVNTVELYPGDTTTGNPITRSSSPISVTIDSITKNRLSSEGKNVIPFTIVANEMGTDMNPDGSTITMIDEMSVNLVLKPETLKITDKNGNTLSSTDYDVVYSTEGDSKVLKITIPDNKKYTIYYECSVVGAPGQTISLANKVNWEGYSDGGDSVVDDNFRFDASVTVDHNPEITLKKMDDHLQLLDGAKFSLYKLKQNQDTTNEKIIIDSFDLGEAELIKADKPASGGQLHFTYTEEDLRFDTVYAIVETEVPDGYVSDDKPIYVAIMKNHGDSTIPRFYTFEYTSVIPGVTVDTVLSGATIEYNSTTAQVNAYNMEAVSISGKKVWEDDDNRDGFRPDSVVLQLQADGVDVLGKTVTLTGCKSSNEQTFTFTDLQKYSAGKEVVYTVVEKNTDSHYSVYYRVDPTGKLIVTNTHTPETVEVSGTKTWDDSGIYGHRPENITIRLHADGVEVDSVTLSADSDSASYTFTDLPKYADGVLIDYEVREDAVNGYISEITKADEHVYNVHNVHNCDKTSLNVSKVWDDNHDQDGFRPDSIKVYLVKDGVKTDEYITLNNGNGWTGSFVNLDYYKDGTHTDTNIHIYSVYEDTVTNYLAPVYDGNQTVGYTITNTHTPETVNITGIKTWNENGYESHRPANITIRLHADGAEVDSVIVSSADNQEYSFTNRPKYKDGKEIVYTVSEDMVLDYIPEYIDETKYEININNVHHCEKVALNVSKVWDDNGDQDGVRPKSVKVYLVKDGTRTDDYVVLDADNRWEAEFTDLEYYKDATREDHFEYTVEEELVDGYETLPFTGDLSTGFVITNKHVPEKVNVTGTKTWDDAGVKGHRPETVTIRLHADGVEIDSRTFPADVDSYEYSFIGLDKYSDGELIKYTITEDTVVGYTPSDPGSSDYEINVHNTHDCEKVSLSVSKTWDDNHNQDGIRPKSVKVYLVIDKVKSTQYVELNELNSWKAEFTGLDYYKNDTHTDYYEYSVEEEDVTGYTASVEGDQVKGYSIKNTHTPETVDITGTKTWDEGTYESHRPAKITIRLHADGVEVDSTSISTADNETYSFTDMPKYKEGKEIVYTVSEDAILCYVPTYEKTGNVINIKNTHDCQKIVLNVSKAWDDNNDQDGIRPDSVKVYLVVDGTKTTQYVELKESNSWEAEFTGLDYYKDSVTKSVYEYTVEEETVSGYETPIITGSQTKGYVVTNRRVPDTVEVKVTKTWVDNNNNDGKRTDIELQLYANDDIVPGKKVTAPASSDSFTYIFTGLPKNKDGEAIKYTVKEVSVPDGYEALPITGDLSTGFVITNKHVPETTSVNVRKIWSDGGDHDGIRPSSVTIVLYADGSIAKDDIGNDITATLNSGNSWTYTFKKLPKYLAGAEIVYTIEEIPVPGYTTSITGSAAAGYTVRNEHSPTYVPDPPYVVPKTGVER